MNLKHINPNPLCVIVTTPTFLQFLQTALNHSPKFKYRNTLILLAIFAAGFLGASCAHASTYYVSGTDGNDSNCTGLASSPYSSGTNQPCPWASVTKVNTKTFSPGDSILFKKTETFSGVTLTPVGSGSLGNVITFSSYGTGANPLISNTSVRGVRLNGNSYLVFDGIDVSASGSDAFFFFTPGSVASTTIQNLNIGISTNGFNFSGGVPSNIVIQNVTVNGASTGVIGVSSGLGISNSSFTNGSTGISISANSANTTSTALTLTNVTASNNSIYGISVGKVDGLTIASTTVSGNSDEGIYFGSGSGVGTNVLISSSTVTNNGNNGAYNGVTVQTRMGVFSIVHSQFSGNHYNGIFVHAPIDVFTVTNSTSTGNAYDGITINAGTSTVSHSYFMNNAYDGVDIAGGTTSVSYSIAANNLNDGFSWNNNGYMGCDHCFALNNGVDGLSSDGDGYTSHGVSSGTITNSYAANNKKTAICLTGTGSFNMQHNVFYHDTVGTLALIFLGGGNYIFANNDVISNGQVGVGVEGATPGGVSNVYNNIVYGFSTGVMAYPGSIVNADYNLVDAGSVNYSGLARPSHDIAASTSPAFMNLSLGDYTLRQVSPAIGAGTSSGFTSTSTDYLGLSIYGTPDIGSYEFQPPFSIGTSLVDPTGNIRIYGDGKYRYITATSSTMSADFSVAPAEGNWTYGVSTTRPEWLNISNFIWNTTGTYSKQWTASSSVAVAPFGLDATTTVYTVGELLPNTSYLVMIDGAASTTISGASCSNSVCTSDGIGRITFAYSGGYSTHIFNVDPASVPSVTSAFASSISETTATLNGSITATGGENAITIGFEYGADTTYGTIVSSSGSFGAGNFSQSLSGLACASNYHFRSFATNPVGSASSTDASFTTSACPTSSNSGTGSNGGGGGNGPVAGSVTFVNAPEPRPQIVYADGRVVYLDEKTASTTQTQVSTSTTSTGFTFTRNRQIWDTGEDIRNLQQFLNQHGFTIATSGAGSPGHEITTFGPMTVVALKKYQESVGLPATGFLGPLTRAVLNATNPTGQAASLDQQATSSSASPTPAASSWVFSLNRQIWDTGEDIRLLQEFLNQHGFVITESGVGSPGHETTTFGPLTVVALRKYQESVGLPATGFLGPLTRAALNKAS